MIPAPFAEEDGASSRPPVTLPSNRSVRGGTADLRAIEAVAPAHGGSEASFGSFEDFAREVHLDEAITPPSGPAQTES